jgi:ubiquinol-cytochrome c reductase cytochrome c1 subunit
MKALIRSLALAAVLLAPSMPLLAAKVGNLDSAGTNVFDRASLQRGASLFVQYCMGCHSMQFQRYQRLATDLDLSPELVEQFLIMGNREITDYMLSSMPYEESVDWFGKAPPDLSLKSRSRGPDWIYTFLRGYYLTEDGWNNTVLENPAMPHVLWDLQGIQRAVTETVTDADGNERTVRVGLELDRAGRLSPAEYDRVVRDITAFMQYVGEPAILKRRRVGVWVLLFLSVFTFLSYLLYIEYWKDVKK